MARQQWHYPKMAKSKIPADENLGKNLHFLMKENHNLRSQTQVAQRTGMSQSSIGRILRGEVNPSAAALNRIAEEFGVDVGDLYLEHEVFAEKHMSPRMRDLKAITGAIDKFATEATRRAQGLVPLFNWKLVVVGDAPETAEWVVCPTLHSDHTYALDVRGLGMFDPAGPISFREGDRIFVDQKVQPAHKSIVVVRIGDCEEDTLRQLIEDGGQWLLLQLNPSWPNRVTPLTKDDAILGTVIAKVQTFN